MFYSNAWFSTAHFAMCLWCVAFVMFIVDRATSHKFEWLNNAAMCVGMVAFSSTLTLWVGW